MAADNSERQAATDNSSGKRPRTIPAASGHGQFQPQAATDNSEPQAATDNSEPQATIEVTGARAPHASASGRGSANTDNCTDDCTDTHGDYG